MPAAGDITYAEDIPKLMGQTIITADSSTWNSTTVVSLATLAVTLVNGILYELRYVSGNVSSTTTSDLNFIELREDSIAGTRIGFQQMGITNTSSVGFGVSVFAQYTAAASASKTFALCGARGSGTGTAQLRHAASRIGFLQLWRLNN